MRGYATYPTCESRGTSKSTRRVCAVRTHAVVLIDGLPFQLFRRPPMSSESVSSNKVKTLNNKPFLLQHPNHKQKSYGTLSQQGILYTQSTACVAALHTLPVNHTKLQNQRVASRSLHTQPTACVAAPHTLLVNYTELQNQRVGCVRYARTRLLD